MVKHALEYKTSLISDTTKYNMRLRRLTPYGRSMWSAYCVIQGVEVLVVAPWTHKGAQPPGFELMPHNHYIILDLRCSGKKHDQNEGSLKKHV